MAQYIDSGASSLLWQLLLTGLVGASFVLRSKIGGLLQRIRSRGRKSSDADESSGDDTTTEVQD